MLMFLELDVKVIKLSNAPEGLLVTVYVIGPHSDIV